MKKGELITKKEIYNELKLKEDEVQTNLNALIEEIRLMARRGYVLSDDFKSYTMESLSEILGILSMSQTWYGDI